jgi:hypothetical protein
MRVAGATSSCVLAGTFSPLSEIGAWPQTCSKSGTALYIIRTMLEIER